MRHLSAAGWLGAAVWLGVIAPATPAATVPSPRPIVVAELFTSEGCSSCPPADEVLRRLAAGELTDTADVVAIGEHVDYWDRLGWRDRFSSSLYTARQSAYSAKVFRSDSIYTPQLVVDGTYESVGSDVAGVRRAVAMAARQPKAAVTINVERAIVEGLRVQVHVEVPASLTMNEPADVLVAVTEDRLVSRVQRGENGGRTLMHAAVARMLTTAGALTPGDRSYSAVADVSISTEWNASNLRIVAFVQERDSRRIIGAGAATRGPGLPGGPS